MFGRKFNPYQDYTSSAPLEVMNESEWAAQQDRMYLIRWKGWGPEADTWEPVSNIHTDEVIQDYLATLDPSTPASLLDEDENKEASPPSPAPRPRARLRRRPRRRS